MARSPPDSSTPTPQDKVLEIPDSDDPAPNIRIDKYDEFGRKMTPREAFRHLSHRFHGKMPGKKKTEKRLQKYTTPPTPNPTAFCFSLFGWVLVS